MVHNAHPLTSVSDVLLLVEHSSVPSLEILELALGIQSSIHPQCGSQCTSWNGDVHHVTRACRET